MLPCKKRKTTQMDSFSEAEALPTEASSPSDGPLLTKPEMEQEGGEVSPTMKSLGDTQRVEPLQEVKEEAEETRLFISVDEREGGKKPRRKGVKRQWEGKSPEEDEGGEGEGEGGGRKLACDLKLDETLDRTLEDGAKQHNLTAVNVRNILHEVITNEHVVAMMKAAISETEDAPVFVSLAKRRKEGGREGAVFQMGPAVDP
ncbi:GON-4-like protein, partial [Notechis scutatus]|uniref:GON-4-like protein n=1 Tax=Notechis scutatus TaxID=8663 RepID=A0A6J1W036_9SAUR